MATFNVFIVEHIVPLLVHPSHHFPRVTRMHAVVAGRCSEERARVGLVRLDVMVRRKSLDELPLFRHVGVAILVHPTGAVGAKYLARKDSRDMALIGTGWQAQGAVHCFAALGILNKIKVYSPTPGNKEKFAKQMSEEAGIEIIPVSSEREAVKDTDIVYMATNSKDPVVMADWLEPGQYVSNVSDVELELAGWERCDVLTMNRHGRRWMRYAIGGAEVIPEHSRDQYTRPSSIDWDKQPLLGDVISGKHPGRTSDNQITGLVLRGDGVQFSAVGHLIYNHCKRMSLGTEIPTELFLQDEKYIP